MSSVDPVVRLLADLDQPARPTVAFRDALLARLLGELDEAMGREPEAQATARSNGWGARVLRAVKRRPGRTMLAFAAVAGAAAAALFISSPWKNSPGVLERAQAALTPPAGSVLHLRWNETHISKDLGCTIDLPTQEVWIDQTPPHRYRVLAWHLPRPPQGADSRTRACRHQGGIVELGRALDTGETTLMFVPPNTLTSAPGFLLTYSSDPVTALRKAIAEGSAHHEGETELDGRTVVRIRIDCVTPRCTAYVDPETFALVREEWPSGFTFRPGPDWSDYRFDVVRRYLTFEYLPRTTANVALTDIRAQHPDATGP